MKLKNNFFTIAEAGINHGGKLKIALKLVDLAAKSGYSAIKFQTYKTEKRVKKNNPAFNILKKCELSFNDFIEISNYCKKKKIIFFSTPFDLESLNFLESINMQLYKISSFDVQNKTLTNEIIKTKKKIIFSTGMSDINSIDKLYKKIDNKKNVTILHCVSQYPNNIENSYLGNIPKLLIRYNCNIGFSDHTNGIHSVLYAYLLGARVFEKHFMLSPKHKCIDYPVSITPKQSKEMITQLSYLKKIISKSKFGLKKEEKNSVIFKRSKIY